MKKMFVVLFAVLILPACSPKIGSEDWCAAMEEKDKGDWTMTETKDYTKHCVF